MTKTEKVTCRYGITYTVTFKGESGAIARSFALMARCCCWVCHNRGCGAPRNEIIPDCYEICELWTKNHYCKEK